MLRLHFGPRTRAFTALWMLEELGEPYERALVDINSPDHPNATLRAVNPIGKVPALEHEGNAFGETAAILIYLADRFPKAGLAPPPSDPRRGRYLQWLIYTPSCVEPALIEQMQKREANSKSSGWGDATRVQDALSAAITAGDWLTGATFTAADLYIGSTLQFTMQFGLAERRPEFEAFVARATARPAYERAREIEDS